MNQTPGSFKVALIQMSVSSDPAANLDRASKKVEEAARAGAQVVCLPELYRSRYFCQTEDAAFFDLAEPVPGPSTERFRELAARLGVVVLVPLFERRAPGLYHNTVVVLDSDGRTAGMYRKMHIPDDPGYYEKYYFTPGDLGFCAFRTKVGTLGVLICWDQWYPEAARITALKGAQILFYPTAIGWLPGEKEGNGPAQREAWRTVQRGHAVANGIYVAAVNRVGHEDQRGAEGIEFWGSSFIADPQGVILAEAGGEEAVIYADVEPARMEDVRRTWPFLRDRRVDAYDGIVQRYLDEGPAERADEKH